MPEPLLESEPPGRGARHSDPDPPDGRQRSAADEALVGTARTAMGGLDALVNNAAVVAGLSRRPFEEIPEDEWDRVLAVNLKGAWLCAKAAVPLLRYAGRGSIVNMASEVAFSGSPGLAHYDASKAALIGLTRVLARELGPDQIRVNALAPGFIPTEASARLSGAGYDTSLTPARSRRSAIRSPRCTRLPPVRRKRVHHRADAARQRRPTAALKKLPGRRPVVYEACHGR